MEARSLLNDGIGVSPPALVNPDHASFYQIFKDASNSTFRNAEDEGHLPHGAIGMPGNMKKYEPMASED